MITLRVIEILMSMLTIALTYTVSTTIAGYMQAWIAKKFGDDTPEEFGFLTLNPLAHIDPLGALCLMVLGIGWGKFIPINPFFINSTIGFLLVLLTPAITYIAVAFLAMLLLLWLFGIEILNIAMFMVLSDSVPLTALTKIYPEADSTTIAVALILVMFTYVGVMFGALTMILNSFRFALSTFLENWIQKSENDFLMFLIPFILMAFLARPLKLFVVYGITYCAYLIASLFGIS